MNVSPIPLDPGPTEADIAEQSQYVTYILYYTTALATIEEAEVIADNITTDGPYLLFFRDGRLVTALPHTSVLQFGELDEANRSFIPSNPDDEGSHIEFAQESKDPWAAITGRE